MTNVGPKTGRLFVWGDGLVHSVVCRHMAGRAVVCVRAWKSSFQCASAEAHRTTVWCVCVCLRRRQTATRRPDSLSPQQSPPNAGIFAPFFCLPAVYDSHDPHCQSLAPSPCVQPPALCQLGRSALCSLSSRCPSKQCVQTEQRETPLPPGPVLPQQMADMPQNRIGLTPN